MKSKKQINAELEIIHAMFPSETTELNWETPFQLLIAVMMSAQCTDKQVNKVTSHLFQTIKNPQDVIALGVDKLKQAIRSIGFFNNKAKNIYNTSHIILTNYSKSVPSTVTELVTLPGVGVKTAKVVTHVLHGTGDIAVDTHVHRVSNRLGRVQTKTPEQTSKLIEGIIYKQNRNIAHHSLVLFGRYHCKAVKPLCNLCPLAQVCIYNLENKK